MKTVSLKIDDLLLDLINPRTKKVQSQRDALQAVVSDQGSRLGALAKDIAEHGLNPADRLLVMKVTKPDGYVALEGNRRVASLKILSNPALLEGLEISASLKKKLQEEAAKFSAATVEPIAGVDMGDRPSARRWIEMRHTGQGQGEGIVNWSGVATARFRGNSASLQAIGFVKRFGDLTASERDIIDDTISISVVDRIMGSATLKAAFGIQVKNGALYTNIAASEVVKPLSFVIKAILSGDLTNRTINKVEDQKRYLKKLPVEAKPDLKQTHAPKLVDDIAQSDFGARKRRQRRSSSDTPKGVYAKSFKLNISVPRIADIFRELVSLEVEKHKNAIAVLLRIILEMTTDEYMDRNNIDRKKGSAPHIKDKSLAEKVSECVAHLIASGTKKHKLSPISSSINNKNSPLYHDLLNQYVHNQYHSPSPSELRTGADRLKSFLEQVWA